jgi:ribosomal protein S18 acetylase RimI-like enzyme
MIEVRPIADGDRAWAGAAVSQAWGVTRVVSRGRLHDATELDGFVAEEGGKPIGLAQHRLDGDECELVVLVSTVEARGAGTSLLAAVREAAVAAGCRRVWLVTTNDNAHAIAFYQRRGWDWVGFHRDAVTEARRLLKPEIPERGEGGVPIRHEIELEILL